MLILIQEKMIPIGSKTFKGNRRHDFNDRQIHFLELTRDQRNDVMIDKN